MLISSHSMNSLNLVKSSEYLEEQKLQRRLVMKLMRGLIDAWWPFCTLYIIYYFQKNAKKL